MIEWIEGDLYRTRAGSIVRCIDVVGEFPIGCEWYPVRVVMVDCAKGFYSAGEAFTLTFEGVWLVHEESDEDVVEHIGSSEDLKKATTRLTQETNDDTFERDYGVSTPEPLGDLRKEPMQINLDMNSLQALCKDLVHGSKEDQVVLQCNTLEGSKISVTGHPVTIYDLERLFLDFARAIGFAYVARVECIKDSDYSNYEGTDKEF